MSGVVWTQAEKRSLATLVRSAETVQKLSDPFDKKKRELDRRCRGTKQRLLAMMRESNSTAVCCPGPEGTDVYVRRVTRNSPKPITHDLIRRALAGQDVKVLGGGADLGDAIPHLVAAVSAARANRTERVEAFATPGRGAVSSRDPAELECAKQIVHLRAESERSKAEKVEFVGESMERLVARKAEVVAILASKGITSIPRVTRQVNSDSGPLVVDHVIRRRVRSTKPPISVKWLRATLEHLRDTGFLRQAAAADASRAGEVIGQKICELADQREDVVRESLEVREGKWRRA